MLKRTIVSVATTPFYRKGQGRLMKAMLDTGFDSAMLFFYANQPWGWPSHKEKPYAFKAFSMMEAKKHGDLLLWVDATVIPIRSMELLWERIERDGYFFSNNGFSNYEWTADSAYADLFPGMPIDEARALNRTYPHVVASAFGLNLRSEIGSMFLEEYFRLARDTRAFCGPWSNSNCSYAPKYGDLSMIGNCGPGDVRGHRHDQTVASVLAARLGMKLVNQPEIYSQDPASEATILLHDGKVE